MTDPELDKMLKAAKALRLEADYLEDFSRQVWANRNRPRSRPRSIGFFPQWAWGLAFALCLLTAIPVWRSREHKKTDSTPPINVLADAKLIRETMAMFPNQLRAIVRDASGIKVELTDQPEVPASPPLLVSVCDGKTCGSFVTFSGQEIKFNGKQFTVLSGGDGGIILEAEKFVWSSKTGGVGDEGLKISARTLDIDRSKT